MTAVMPGVFKVIKQETKIKVTVIWKKRVRKDIGKRNIYLEKKKCIKLTKITRSRWGQRNPLAVFYMEECFT